MPQQQNAQPAPKVGNDGVAAVHLPPPEQSRRPPIWLMLGVSVLLVLALFVIFVLPQIVAEYELPFERALLPESAPVVIAPQPSESISPFEEAVQARERERAQEVLANILDTREQLDDLRAAQWAAETYDAAVELARLGDEHYRNRDFDLAHDSYRGAADSLTDLLLAVPETLARFLAEGEAALQNDDPTLAAEKFNFALMLDPGNAAASDGLAIARNFEQIMNLLAQAGTLEEDGALDQALARYREVLALDADSEAARSGVSRVTANMTQNEFSAIMSAGFALLEANDPEAATAEFERAALLGINRDQVDVALEQTRNQVASVEIARLRGQIDAASAGERWLEAVGLYDQVLQIDGNLLFALEGRDYSGKRLQLENLLNNALADPYQLSDELFYQNSLDAYYTGRALPEAGPKLVGQLDALEPLLVEARIPQRVEFVSDNLTDVLVFRVAELGRFEQTELELLPGRYIALGRRIGFREVREQFEVGFGQAPSPISIICDERFGGSGGL